MSIHPEIWKTTRSILVIEEELDLRILLLEALSAENWKVIFALTEKTIQEAVQTVAGVIMNSNLPEVLNRDEILKIIGDVPLIMTDKNYQVADLVKETKEKMDQGRFFVGDRVMSRTTPDWGEGRVVSLYPDQYYGVIFKSEKSYQSQEVALRCHYTGLKWIKG
jgi:hypothetical protein